MRYFIFVLGVAFLAQSGSAQVAGTTDARYLEARAAWLGGEDDLAALGALRDLALADNLDAQVLLGLIERSTNVPALERGDHRDIFRRPDGRFGVRWLRVAAPQSEVAALLVKHKPEDYRAHSKALADAGLIPKAIDMAQVPANQGDFLGTLHALSHPSLLPYTRVRIENLISVLLAGATFAPELLPEQLEEGMALETLYLKSKVTFKDRLLSSHRRPLDEDIVRMQGAGLLYHPELKPLAALVSELCPEDTPFHMGMIAQLYEGANLLVSLLSPYAPVISNEDWQKSGRFRADLLRDFWRVGRNKAVYAEKVRCFAEAMAQAAGQPLD